MKRQIHLTTPAYEGLIKLAYQQKYIQARVVARGISVFVNHLSTIKYRDNRPFLVRAEDQSRLEGGLLPDWKRYVDDYTEPRFIDLTQTAILSFIDISNEFGIRGKHDTPMALVGSVLEAIGSDWLIPVDGHWPNNPPVRAPKHFRNTFVELG